MWKSTIFCWVVCLHYPLTVIIQNPLIPKFTKGNSAFHLVSAILTKKITELGRKSKNQTYNKESAKIFPRLWTDYCMWAVSLEATSQWFSSTSHWTQISPGLPFLWVTICSGSKVHIPSSSSQQSTIQNINTRQWRHLHGSLLQSGW